MHTLTHNPDSKSIRAQEQEHKHFLWLQMPDKDLVLPQGVKESKRERDKEAFLVVKHFSEVNA